MRPHPPQRVPLVSANRTPVGLHPRVRFHVSLCCTRRGADHVTARTLPAGKRPRRDALMSWFGDSSALPAPPHLVLVPLEAVVGLVRVQVVQGGKFDAASETDQLLVLTRRTCGTRAAWTNSTVERFQISNYKKIPGVFILFYF